MKRKLSFILVVLLIILLLGCTNNEQNAHNLTEPLNNSYPIDGINTDYPVSNHEIDEMESGYPITEDDNTYVQGPKFSIDKPVYEDDNIVSGTGPADVPIILIDVSEVDTLLGETIIEEDGSFSFMVENQLESGHTIGIMLGDLTGTEFNQEDFLNSETYYERPLIGILFDLVVVE